MDHARNERSASKQDVRSSVEAHQDSVRRRSRSVASLVGHEEGNSRFRSPSQQDAVQIADEGGDGWNHAVAYGLRAGRPDRLAIYGNVRKWATAVCSNG